MELGPTVETRGHQEQEIAVEARRHHLVGETLAALVAHLELSGRCELYSGRTAAAPGRRAAPTWSGAGWSNWSRSAASLPGGE